MQEPPKLVPKAVPTAWRTRQKVTFCCYIKLSHQEGCGGVKESLECSDENEEGMKQLPYEQIHARRLWKEDRQETLSLKD